MILILILSYAYIIKIDIIYCAIIFSLIYYIKYYEILSAIMYNEI